MKATLLWSRILVIVGLALMLIGAFDPLEGSLVILPGSGMVVLGAFLGRSRRRTLLLYGFILLAVGVGALWGMSALGGFGGHTGRSMWWALVLLPYPVGWIMGLVGAILRLIESSKGQASAEQQAQPHEGREPGAEADAEKLRH
jgi:MFS family permease